MLRKAVVWSIKNHYLFMAPLFLLEFYRDCLMAHERLGIDRVSQSIIVRVLAINNVVQSVCSRESLLKGLELVHRLVTLSTLQLFLEKIYISANKVPR